MAQSASSRSARRKAKAGGGATAQPREANLARANAVVPADEHGLGPVLRAHIGTQLRAIYHEIVSEQVPDRFVRLLDDLARKEQASDEH